MTKTDRQNACITLIDADVIENLRERDDCEKVRFKSNERITWYLIVKTLLKDRREKSM